MPAIIHCIRHGQGLHNQLQDYTLPDPYLTHHGETQCDSLRLTAFSSFTTDSGSNPDIHHDTHDPKISLIFASPLTRTLHSASIIFGPTLRSTSTRILAVPDAQETSSDPCDIGSSPSILNETVTKNAWPVDLSLIHDGWNDKSLRGRYSPHSDAIFQRARDLRVFIRDKIREYISKRRCDGGESDADDVHVALVTHGGFLHFFTGDWEGAWEYPATGWVNCERRMYRFECDPLTRTKGDDHDDDLEARVVETEESRKMRGKTGAMFGRDKQEELFGIAMEMWEGQGLERPDRVGMDGYIHVGDGGVNGVAAV